MLILLSFVIIDIMCMRDGRPCPPAHPCQAARPCPPPQSGQATTSSRPVLSSAATTADWPALAAAGLRLWRQPPLRQPSWPHSSGSWPYLTPPLPAPAIPATPSQIQPLPEPSVPWPPIPAPPILTSLIAGRRGAVTALLQTWLPQAATSAAGLWLAHR